MKNTIAIISFNNVQNELYNILAKKGFDCEKISLSNSELMKNHLKDYKTVFLPFPSKKENFCINNNEIISFKECFTKGQLIVGGLFDEDITRELKEGGIDYLDYFTSEAYMIKNAYITTQGVLRLLFENTNDYIGGKNALITGFGRIGKSLAYKLKELGTKVFVAVRSDVQAADASASGFDVFKLSQLKSVLFYFDFIFNTVPYMIFDERDISRLKEESVYFEIASKPFGADENLFREYQRKYVCASALPGKLYPEAVAKNIYSCVFSCADIVKGDIYERH